MEKNPEPGSGINIQDLFFDNIVSVFWVKKNLAKFFDADPGSCRPWIWDPKRKK
jgi:hypothetical protein